MSQAADLLLDGGTVITMDPDRRVFLSGAVAVRAHRSVAVGRRSEILRTWSGRRTIDTNEAISQ